MTKKIKCNFTNSVEYIKCLESFLILSRIDLGDNLFQLSLGFALREVAHVVILWCNPENKYL